MESISGKLARIQREKGTDFGLILRPKLAKMPLPMQRYDDPFLPFGKAILDATHDLLCAIMFDLASYMALGGAGMVALERTIAYAKGSMVTVLDAPFVGRAFGQVMGEQSFHVDTITMFDIDEALSVVKNTPSHAVFLADGLPDLELSDLQSQIGSYHPAVPAHPARLLLGSGDSALQVTLLGDEVVYAGVGDDFAQQARYTLQNAKNLR